MRCDICKSIGIYKLSETANCPPSGQTSLPPNSSVRFLISPHPHCIFLQVLRLHFFTNILLSCCYVVKSHLTLCDPMDAAHQASLSFTTLWSLLKLISIESMMPSNHLILCGPLLLLPSIFPSIRGFSNESTLCIRWPKYWTFSFSISPSNEYSGLIPFRTDCCCWVTSVVSDSVWPHRRQPTRLPRTWDSPGKNTGVGCHFLLQCMKVKSESEVAQSCPTLSDPMDCSLPGSSIHGIF